MRLLWSIWYRLFPPLPRHVGDRDDPLDMEDVGRLQLALRRIEGVRE